MTVKFGIKLGAMLSSLVLALVCFVGCNSDETPRRPLVLVPPRPRPPRPAAREDRRKGKEVN